MTTTIVGESIPRIDGVAKVTGKAKYTTDLCGKDILIEKILRIPHAHAVIKSIDTSKAVSLSGIETVLTYKDVSQKPYNQDAHPSFVDPNFGVVRDRYILMNKPRYIGDPIAAVVAKDKITARQALKLIDVDYEIFEGRFIQRRSIIKKKQSFIEEGAFQCGFCTPGFMMSATSLVKTGKKYTREEIKKGLSRNLCRCTGYQSIVNAVEKALKD